MFSITEQFSAATKSQLESQLKIINSFASTAVASAQQVIALNLSTTKATVAKSSRTAKQLLEARDPQEFIKASTSEPPSFDSLLAYSNELFSIASKAQAELIRVAGAQVKEAPVLPVMKLSAPMAATVVAKEAAAPANEPEAAPKAAAKPAPPKAKPAEPVAEVPVVAVAVEKPVVEAAAKPSFPAPPPKPAAALIADTQQVALKPVPAAKGKAPSAEKQK